MTQNQKIKAYLLNHPVDDAAKNKYADVCKKFKITIKRASGIWRAMNKEVAYNYEADVAIPVANNVVAVRQAYGDKMDVTVNKVDHEVKTLEDLLAVCEVDTREWEVISWQCKKWDLGIKNADEAIETKELFSVSAKFRQRKVDEDLSLQKDVIIKELFDYAPKFKDFKPIIADKKAGKDKLLEIDIFDMHFGKLAHREEVGEDYDLKIATERYNKAIESLLSRVNLNSVERILFPIGQDLINIDNLTGTTTAGTPQDCDSRFHKIVRTVKAILIKTITELSTIAPVDVVIVPGNHDEQTTFLLGEVLEAYFYNNHNVNVSNEPTARKYYQFGKNGMMFSHGHREKFNDLGMIFAAENPKLWGSTEFRHIKIGHLHHNKVQVMQKQEFQGFIVSVLPSLSGTDKWHEGKGFKSLKQAKAFLYDRNEGQIGEFTFTSK